MGNLGKIIITKGFEKLPKSIINCSIWSHWTHETTGERQRQVGGESGIRNDGVFKNFEKMPIDRES